MKNHSFQCLLILLFVSLISKGYSQEKSDRYLHIIYASDMHFGINKKEFRGSKNVSSKKVNQAMVATMNHLPKQNFPNDSGVQARDAISYIDYLFITGDVANRMQPPVQKAKNSWQQFQQVYVKGLKTENQDKQLSPILVTPGNHDVSNAIGYYKKMQPLTDPSSYIGIYNMMKVSPEKLTASNFDYYKQPINYSRNVGGIHFVFVNIWPDSSNIVWMENDLKDVDTNTPVIIFAHDPPEGDPHHFSGAVKDNAHLWKNRYENLLVEKLQDEPIDSILTNNYEQRLFVQFLKKHPNIKAYFHGHENYTEFYSYTGPDNDVNIPVFRVDSPMKGNVSKKNEKDLAYEIIDIDTQTKQLTVRECLWNANKKKGDVEWGKSKTIQL